jgi:predicted methyltransferase
MRAGIDPDKTVWEVISGGGSYIRAGRAKIPSRAYVAAFGFKGSDQQSLPG